MRQKPDSHRRSPPPPPPPRPKRPSWATTKLAVGKSGRAILSTHTFGPQRPTPLPKGQVSAGCREPPSPPQWFAIVFFTCMRCHGDRRGEAERTHGRGRGATSQLPPPPSPHTSRPWVFSPRARDRSCRSLDIRRTGGGGMRSAFFRTFRIFFRIFRAGPLV